MQYSCISTVCESDTDQYHTKATSVKSMTYNLRDVSGVCISVFLFLSVLNLIVKCYTTYMYNLLIKLDYLRYYRHSFSIYKEKNHIHIHIDYCTIVCFYKELLN